MELFYKFADISMVCGVPVHKRKEEHGQLMIDPLLDLLLFAQANSLKESHSGVVNVTGQTRSIRSLNTSCFSYLLSK